ncbi:MAG: GNAT family N-acetyltransferase [Candidatus Poribacteria bacterium]
MSDKVEVRSATLADANGITEIHAECDDPWANLAECAIWVNHQLLRGFFIDVAVIGNQIVGHAEWLLSDEPSPYGKHLYLSMIQVHSDYQRRGVGRAMIEAGIHRAKVLSCPVIRTVPDDDAKDFYKKCGFLPSRRNVTCSTKVCPTALPSGWKRSQVVPQKVVNSLPMRFGWVQGSSAHMWEICNRPVYIFGQKPEQHPCARRSDGMGYVQLRYVGMEDQPMALAWAPLTDDSEELVLTAIALANSLPVEVEFVTFTLEDRYESDLVSCRDVQWQWTLGNEIWSKAVD